MKQKLTNFLDHRHSMRARIFFVVSVLTIFIVSVLSVFWYKKSIALVTDNLVVAVDANMADGLHRLDNMLEDISRMHATIIYETSGINYIFREAELVPSVKWFAAYGRLYNNLRTMHVSLSRWVSGIGIFSRKGFVSIQGILSVEEGFFTSKAATPIREAGGGDLLFFAEKEPGERRTKVEKNIYVGRTIKAQGRETALILSKINESVVTDAFESILPDKGYVVVLDSAGSLIYHNRAEGYDVLQSIVGHIPAEQLYLSKGARTKEYLVRAQQSEKTRAAGVYSNRGSGVGGGL